MKKIFIIIAILFLNLSTINACEICGCGINNFYIGILPQFSHRFLGLRYHFNSFSTRLTNDPTQFSKDFYQTVELWGGWNIGKRWQVLGVVPMNFNRQNSDEGLSHLHGLGDIMVVANYKLLDVGSVNGNGGLFSQQLWIGGGLKLPTGKFDIEKTDPDVSALANDQLGSGTVDFLLDAMYNVHFGNIGVNTSASYKINGTNGDQYRFGNKLSVNSLVYFPVALGKTTVSPNLGVLYEHTRPSSLDDSKIDLTGGNVVQGSAGAEFGLKRLSFGFNVQLPLAQNFAENQTKEKIKGMAHVSVAF
jgi:hypothetical protein